MEPTETIFVGPNNGEHVGSAMLHTVHHGQGAAKHDVSSSNEVSLATSIPTISLISDDSFASNCSDYSVDVTPCDGYNLEAGRNDSGQDDSQCMLPNGHLSKSSSLVNALEHIGNQRESNKRGENENILDNLDLRTPINGSGLIDDDSARCVDPFDEEDGSSPTFDDKDKIWDLPEAENENDDKENSMATLAEDDDECADVDGTEWAQPSSLNSFEDWFKEEKQKAMEGVMNGRFKNLVRELLKKLGLTKCDEEGENWVDITTLLAWQAASFVKPDASKGKAMDPAGYVKIKCIASGSRSESKLIKGLVFKKHAAHRHMPTKFKNPRLLLIQGMLGQSSGSSGLSAFSSMITQDKNNIEDLVENLKTCHPNVILVEKSASRDLLEEFARLKITLVLDMKLHRLERVARCTGSHILTSNFITPEELKHCDSVYFEKFVEEHAMVGEGEKKPSKTLMFLEGCPTRLGCTILLKGSPGEELKKVKCVVQCAVVMAYHYILETSFLVEQKAMFFTIAFGQASNILSMDKQSMTVVPEISNNPHIEEPNVGGASTDGVLVSNCSNEQFFHAKETFARAAEIATSNGFHEKVPCGTQLVNGLSMVRYEPSVRSLSSASSFVSDALEKVSFFSPATYQNMSTYIEAQTAASVPAPTEMALDQCDVDAKDSSEEDKTLHNHSQPLSMMVTASEDARKFVDDGEDCIRPQDEISSVLDSESILVLMSSRNANKGTICEQSHFSHIKFYRHFDVPLGKFLQDNLFNESLQCEACNELPAVHFYYYAHHNKQLTIRVKQLGDNLLGKSGRKLWMWSRCGKCEPHERKATKRILMSAAARGLSFGKFLELSFSSYSSFNRLSSCGHSVQKDFLYFFGLGSMVAMFQYSRVARYTVSLPAQMLEFNTSISRDWVLQEIESVYTKGLLLYSEVANYLKKIESRFCVPNLDLNGSSKVFADILGMLKTERSFFEENIKNISIKNESSHVSVHKLLSLNRLQWEIVLEACIWDQRLQLVSPSPVSSAVTNVVVPRQMDLEESSAAVQAEDLQTFVGKGVQGQMEYGPEGEAEGTRETSDEELQGKMDKDHKILEGRGMFEENCVGEVEEIKNVANIYHYNANCTDLEVQSETIAGADKLLPTHEVNVQMPTSENSVPCGSLQESENTVLPFNSDGPHTDNIPLSGNLLKERSRPVIDGEDDCCSVDHKDVSEKLATSTLPKSEDFEGWVWNSFAQIREECMKDLRKGSLPKLGHFPKFELLNPPDFSPMVSQVINEEGMRLHIPVSDGDYIVTHYNGEISSAVACALAMMKDQMPPYSNENAFLKRASSEPLNWPLRGSIDPDIIHSAPSMPTPESRFSSFDGLNSLESKISHEPFNPEINLSSENNPVKYSVVVNYAYEFYGLRSRCCPSELDYIASLSRCKNWDAKGGKSKSFFAKTLDDRLIIKEIKKTEFDSFMKFAPHYFRYMMESFTSGSQTCLAKILGIYQVTVRHAKSGKETKHDLMVQENLSFGRNITRQYDLKGALHARFTATADGTEDVLLDQNFVNDMNLSPLYIGQKSKRLLQRAVWNDTTFLNSINVMDYSLLVGVDGQRHELVCGIIDYLRQYTWDKRFETWVKSSLAVPKNVLPTIVSPAEYKKRFRKFMDTHFLTVPDRWCSQRSSKPCKLCGIKGDNCSIARSEKQEEERHDILSP